MKCERCSGLLMREWISRTRERDPSSRGWWWRCVNCGARVDGTVLRNRAEQEAETAGRREALERDLQAWSAWLDRVPYSPTTSTQRAPNMRT